MQEKNSNETWKAEAIERFLTFLGLCRRAGKTAHGTPLVCEALASHKPPSLVILSQGASAGTAKKIKNKCDFYRVPMLTVPATPERLGRAVGKSAEIAAVAVLDESFAGKLRNLYLSGKASADAADEGVAVWQK